MVTWKILYCGDKEEKGTRTTTPKPCRRNTACAAQQSGGSPQEEWSLGTTALRSCRVALDAIPSHPLPVAWGRHHSVTVTMESKAQGWSAKIMWHHALQRSILQTFLGSSLLFQVGSQMWHKGLSCLAMQVGQAHYPGLFCSLPLQAHTGQLDGRTWRSLWSAEGKDMLKVT